MNKMGLLDRLDDDADVADEAASIEEVTKEVEKTAPKKKGRRARRSKAKEETIVDDEPVEKLRLRRKVVAVERGNLERRRSESSERLVKIVKLPEWQRFPSGGLLTSLLTTDGRFQF